MEHYSKDSDGLCVNLCKPCVQVSRQGNVVFKTIVCFDLIAHYTSDLPPNVWMRGMTTFAFDIVMPWFVHFEMPNTCILKNCFKFSLYFFHVSLINTKLCVCNNNHTKQLLTILNIIKTKRQILFRVSLR